MSTTVPSPAVGSFSFSGGSGAVSSLASNIAPAAPAAGGFSFAASKAPDAPLNPGTGVLFGSSGASQHSTAFGASAPETTKNTTIKSPYFESIFKSVRIWKELKELAEAACQDTDEGRLAGQQLVQLLQNYTSATCTASILLHPVTLQYRRPDMNLRHRLSEHPVVTVTSVDEQQHDATLTRSIFVELCALADSLYISEEESLSLYHFMCTQRDSLLRFDTDWEAYANIYGNPRDRTIVESARMYYFYERSLILRTSLMLLQYRQSSKLVAAATDFLLQQGWIGNLLQTIREYTTLSQQLRQKVEQPNLDMKHNSFVMASGSTKRQNDYLQEHLEFCLRERQVAAECIFFITYDVQLTTAETVAILDLVKDLTNGTSSSTPDGTGLRQLNPFVDVPDPYELPPETTTQAFMVSMTRSTWTQQRKEKDNLEWQRQLVDSVHKTGYPALLRCVSTLIVSCMAALDTHNILMDRSTHEPNAFGKVSKTFFVNCK